MAQPSGLWHHDAPKRLSQNSLVLVVLRAGSTKMAELVLAGTSSHSHPTLRSLPEVEGRPGEYHRPCALGLRSLAQGQRLSQ
jgi:hypothetical protein